MAPPRWRFTTDIERARRVRESEVYILYTQTFGGGEGGGENENERWGSAVPGRENRLSGEGKKKGGDEDVDDDAPTAKHTHTRHFAHRK